MSIFHKDRSIPRRTLSLVLVVCMLFVSVFGFTSKAWAADSGVYAFICQKGGGGDYVMVIKNGDADPDVGDYGTPIRRYTQNLYTLTTATEGGGWPWRANGTLDSDAAKVKKVVFDGPEGSIALTNVRGMFAYFSHCTFCDFTGLFEEGYTPTTWNFDMMLYKVYDASTNDDVTVVLGSDNKIRSLSLAPTLYREINGVYDIVPGELVPQNIACTLYSKPPADCHISPYLSEYELTFSSATVDPISGHPTFVIDGTSDQVRRDISVRVKDYPEVVLPSGIGTLRYERFDGTKWGSFTIVPPQGLGHYRVYAVNTLLNNGYDASVGRGRTVPVEYDIVSAGTLTLYVDEGLQIPVDSGGLDVTGVTNLYVKCETALSGLQGTAEMKVAATSSDPSTLAVTTIAKVGDYNTDGFCVYKITLSPVKAGPVNLKLWGYVNFNGDGGSNTAMICTFTTVHPVNVEVLPATLTLGAGAQQILSNLEMAGDTVVVDLAYEGRPLESIDPEEIIVEDVRYSYQNPGSYEIFYGYIETAHYDSATGKLSVTPNGEDIRATSRSGILRVTVPGAGLYGQATIEIPITVSRITPTITATLPNGQPIAQPLKLKAWDVMEITLTYSGEAMRIGSVSTTNSAIADIVDYEVKPDGKSAVLTVQAKAASASSATLGVQVYSSSTIYATVFFNFTVQVPKTDIPLNVSQSTLELTVGQSGTVSVSGDEYRALTFTSSDEAVAKATLDLDTKILTVEALGVGTATITLSAAATATLNASDATVQVTVTKAGGALSISPDVLELKAGKSGTVDVSYEGDGALTFTSSDEAVAQATLDLDTKILTIEALGVGTATITLSAAATETSDAEEVTLQVTVSAPDPLSGDPEILELTPGKSGTVAVSYEGDGALTFESSDEAVAQATLDLDTKILTVEALGVGTATITLSAAATENSEAAEATLQVTVSKDVAPPLDIDTNYVLVVGEGSWTVEYSEALDYQVVQSSSIIEVIASNSGKTLTVTPKAKGSAVLTISAKETTTTQALAPVSILFTVNEPAPPVKPIEELQPLVLQVGATATAPIELKDANNNPLSAAPSVSSSDTQVAEVSYDTTARTLSIHALRKGETIITISSAALAKDYILRVSVYAPPTPFAPKLDAGTTGVSVSGTVQNIPEGTDVRVIVRALTSGSTYNSITAAATGNSYTPLAIYEAVLTVGGIEKHDGFGTLTFAFPVDAALEGSEVTVLHLHTDGRITSERVRVQDGRATIKATDLSTFAVTVVNPTTSNNTSGSGNTTTGSTSGSGSLVTGTGSTSSGNTSGTGSLVTTTGSSNTSGTGSLVTNSGSNSSSNTGSLVTDSESSGSDDALSNTGTTALADATTPLASRTSTQGTSDAWSDQQSDGMNPWVVAAIIGSAVLVIGAALLFFLRRRRHRMAELDEVLVGA
jgi:uncharacterized cupredoxin-like copper-binding protein